MALNRSIKKKNPNRIYELINRNAEHESYHRYIYKGFQLSPLVWMKSSKGRVKLTYETNIHHWLLRRKKILCLICYPCCLSCWRKNSWHSVSSAPSRFVVPIDILSFGWCGKYMWELQARRLEMVIEIKLIKGKTSGGKCLYHRTAPNNGLNARWKQKDLVDSDGG